MRPNSLLARTYLRRGASIWLGTRLIFAAVSRTRPSPSISIEVIVLAVVLSFVDTRRRRERALLGNLGIGPLVLTALFALPAIAGELAVGLSFAIPP